MVTSILVIVVVWLSLRLLIVVTGLNLFHFDLKMFLLCYAQREICFESKKVCRSFQFFFKINESQDNTAAITKLYWSSSIPEGDFLLLALGFPIMCKINLLIKCLYYRLDENEMKIKFFVRVSARSGKSGNLV